MEILFLSEYSNFLHHLLLPIVLILQAYEHIQKPLVLLFRDTELILIIQCLPASAALIFEFVEIIVGTNNLSAITFVPTQPDQGLPKFILLSFNSPIRILPSYLCCPISVLRSTPTSRITTPVYMYFYCCSEVLLYQIPTHEKLLFDLY